MALVTTALSPEAKTKIVITSSDAAKLAIEAAKRDLGAEFEEIDHLDAGTGGAEGGEEDEEEGEKTPEEEGEKTPELLFSSPSPVPEPKKTKKNRRRSKAAAAACQRGKKIAAMAKKSKK